ncbi:hypothetical protein EDC21_1201 [Thermohydrogenium kirishiense]|nr:hypothetical protein EDC21_1201 [Thermohydrogenium kirishiense]
MKKIIIICTAFAVTAISLYFSIFITYNIYNTRESERNAIIKKVLLQNKMVTILDSSKEILKNSINIEKTITIDNVKFILFSYSLPKVNFKFVGSAILKKGINNKYKIESFGYGTNLNNDCIIKIGKENHLVLYGINYKGKIAKIVGKYDNRNYEVNINIDDEFYLKDFKLNEMIENTNSISMNWTLYDNNLNDITNQINREYDEEVLRHYEYYER